MPRHSRLARLLQLIVLAHLAVAAAWAAWRWPVSPGQAVAGAAFVLLLGPLVLALEFVLAARVNRSDARAPLASASRMVAAWLLECVHLYLTFAWRQPFRWRAVGDRLDGGCAGRTGVVFVHGFMCNRGFWNAWMRRLCPERRAWVAVNLEPVYGSIDAYAPIIQAAVARVAQATGRPPVLVCHSMGGVAARAWWRADAGAHEVAAIVTIASPHEGTWMGRFSTHENGRQMRIACDWLQALARDERARPLPRALCWYTNCDNMVFPTATAALPGADNRLIAGQPHVALAFHPAVLEGTLELLRVLDAEGQGESVTSVALENG